MKNVVFRNGLLAGVLLSTLLLTSTVSGQVIQGNESAISDSVLLEDKGWKVEVANWQELKDALSDEYVSDITLANDLTLESTVAIQGGEKHIHGNGHTLDANSYQIYFNEDSSIGSIASATIINTDIYGLLWSDNQNVQITYENITHSGKQMIYLPNGKLILAGKVSSHSDTEEVFQGKEIELTTGAEVLFENDSTLWAPVSMDYDQAKLTIGTGASFTLNSSSIGIYGGTNFILTNQGDLEVTSKLHQAIHLASKSKMNFEAGSSTKANGGDTIEEAVEATSGSIFVRTGADFVAESKGTQGTLIAGEKIVFEDGANFSITNHNKNGVVMGSYTTPTDVSIASTRGINTWNLGNSEASQPDKVYQKTTATFTLSGYLSSVKQTNMQSSNADFSSTYVTGQTSKIQGGTYVGEKIDAPVFNVVNDKDKQLTGLGTPGATINAYVDGVLLGTGVVGADGRWTISIEPQAEGTKIDVNQVVDGNESEFVSQVVSHLDQTVNFFKLGYWQGYGLILEGSIDNGSLDLTNKDAVKKTLHLTATDGTEVGTFACANHDWYNTGVFNGYQAIVEDTVLAGLEPGEYKLSITLEVGDFKETQDLNVASAVRDNYAHIFTEIPETTVGSHTIAPLDKDGIGYLVVK